MSRIPHFLCKVLTAVNLSALRAGHALFPRNIPGTHMFVTGSVNPKTIVRLEGLRKLKKFIDEIRKYEFAFSCLCHWNVTFCNISSCVLAWKLMHSCALFLVLWATTFMKIDQHIYEGFPSMQRYYSILRMYLLSRYMFRSYDHLQVEIHTAEINTTDNRSDVHLSKKST
jgi:hypothetical protein